MRERMVAALVLVAMCATSARLHASVWPSQAQRIYSELKDPSEEVRIRAARRLSTLPVGTARGGMERVLSDSSKTVRLTAARGAVARELVGLGDFVAGWLKEADSEGKILAARLMIRTADEEQLSEIGALLTDQDRAVRVAAARVLGRVSESRRRLSANVLLSGLDDSEADVRREVAASLGRVGVARDTLSLAARLSDQDPNVRVQVALALGVIGDPAAVPALLVGLSDSEEHVVRAVAHSLGKLRAESAVAGLVAVVRREPLRSPGEAAIRALARINTPTARRALYSLLGRSELGRVVVDALKTTAAGVELESCLKNAAAEELLLCLELEIALTDSVGAVLNALNDGRLRVQQALFLMRDHGGSQAALLALENLSDDEPGKRGAALQFLARKMSLPRFAAAPIELALAGRAWTIAETRTLLELLAACGAARSLGTAREYMRSTDATIRAVAARLFVAAGAVGSELQSVLRHQRPEIRQGALRGLSKRTSVVQAQQIIDLLAKAKVGLRRELLQTLWTAPAGLSERALEQLERLLHRATGGDRDSLISAFAHNGDESRVLRLVMAANTADQLKWVQNARFHKSGVALARVLATRGTRVKAMALRVLGERGGEQDARLISEVTNRSASSLVRAAGMFALAQMVRREVPVSFSPSAGDCFSSHPRVRLGAQVFAYENAQTCGGQHVSDLILYDSDARVRQLMARAVYSKEPEAHALSVCAQYEPRLIVQKQCAGRPETTLRKGALRPAQARTQFELRAPAVRGPARLMPVALWEQGDPRVSMSDRNGNVVVPASAGTIADPWWAY